MKMLNDQILACVQATAATMNDHDQRSAIGMADSFLRTGKEIERSQSFPQLMKNRDDLAIALVDILRDNKLKDSREAMAAVREWLNEPFRVSSMSGQQAKGVIEKHKDRKSGGAE